VNSFGSEFCQTVSCRLHSRMIEVRLTYAFRDWRDGLRDCPAKAALAKASANCGSIMARDTECITCGVGRY
jgi:hypothetical protein